MYVYQQHDADPPAVVASAAPQDAAHQGEDCAISLPEDRVGATPSTFATAGSEHPGATCCVANASQGGVLEQFGDENTIHWMVPPGRHRYRTEVTEQMNLPFDTTAHYVTGHLHPFGRSIRFVDLDTGEELFHVTGTDFDDRLGVMRMSETVRPEGVPLRKDGRYELIADYDNTSGEPVDAMAIFYFYALDEDPADVTAPRSRPSS